ncbi:ribose 5-phosphate isomerase B [Patescibacteria group bacterium]
MDFYIGSDHAGYKLKQAVKKYLDEKEHKYTDLGSFNGEDSVDYPDIAREVAEKVQEYPETMGIMICGTGQGSAMVLNRHKKIRAALCNTEELAELAREHNHANVLCLGERTTDEDLAIKIVDKFINTPVSADERHKRRVDMFDNHN